MKLNQLRCGLTLRSGSVLAFGGLAGEEGLQDAGDSVGSAGHHIDTAGS